LYFVRYVYDSSMDTIINLFNTNCQAIHNMVFAFGCFYLRLGYFVIKYDRSHILDKGWGWGGHSTGPVIRIANSSESQSVMNILPGQ